MKKLKKCVCALLVSSMMFCSLPAWAAEEESTTTGIPTFSLDEVKTLVEKNSANRDAYELQESIYKLTKKSALENLAELDTNSEYWLGKMQQAEAAGDQNAYNLAYNYYSTLNETYMQNAPAVESALEQVNDSLDDLDRQLGDLNTDLDLTATLLYSKLLELGDSRDLMEQNLDLLLANRQVVQLQQNLGMATNLDLSSINQQITSLTQSITTLDSGIDNIKRTLNNLMGFDLDYKFNIKPWETGVVLEDFIPMITTEMIDTALNNDLTLEQLERKMGYTRSDIKKSDDTSEIASLKNDLKSLEIQYDNQETAVKNTLNSYRTALVDAKNAYINAQTSYDIAKTNLDFAQAKYDLGMISALTLDNEKINFKQAQDALTSAEYGYYFAKIDYELYQKGKILTVYNSCKQMQ